MEAAVIENPEIRSDNGARRKRISPAQPDPGAAPRKPYTKPQITLECDLETVPACWRHPSVVTSHDRAGTIKPAR